MPTEDLTWLPPVSPAVRKGAVTIGNFDGVHLGHSAILNELIQSAKAAHGSAVVMTFDPHPLQVLRPEKCLPNLSTTADRTALLRASGVDEVVVIPASRALLRLTARAFFDDVIRNWLAPRALVEGPDFGFGHNREGNVGLLEQWCKEIGIGLKIVPPLVLDGLPISSSRIRSALLAGDVKEAARLLGRCYQLRGIVATGQQRGNKLGFPTANLEKIPTLIPGNGVYAVWVQLESRRWPGAANIGPNPTFGENARKVEVHLIGFHGEIYRRELAVDFVDRLRDTRPFSSANELIDQLHSDVAQAKEMLK
ncbi:MAG: bifunctional riboflavin kinase/FAD synthetase [Gemmataceae bacterium]